MVKPIYIKKSIKKFDKKIFIDGDKSLSIRWAIMASQAIGKSRAYNLLKSQDVKSTMTCLKKIGVKFKWKNNYCEMIGNGLNNFVYKNNLTLNAGNSGTLARLILPLLINSPKKIKIIGDKSLSKRDMKRVITPLEEFGATFFPKKKKNLPLHMQGSNFVRPINYYEQKGSAQVKSCIMLAALNAPGKTIIKAKKSRNHSEILFKSLKIPIKIKKTKNYDLIEIIGKKNYKGFSYKIPSDISSSAFFIVLTLLAKNSRLIIKNCSINETRIGVIKILNKMGAKIFFKNKKNYKGEKIADIHVKSRKYLRGIKCSPKFNSSAIDEFLIIFLAAAKAKGISYFSQLQELNLKESRRLDWGSKILNMIGIKTKLTNHSIKIYGQPNLKLNKKYEIKNYLKDHRVMAMSTIAALTLGGEWKIHDPDSINTSFPSFFKIIRKNFKIKIK